ncbi:MAG: MFS transporter, partial [Planctomycetes bacterium]|nr:MFS transporter [Planctomycetota bacterium]
AVSLKKKLTLTIAKPAGASSRSVKASLATLKHMRVWRFGLYYFLVFGMFVALAQWLIPYYVNVYAMSIVTAGLMATIFTLPSGVIRALGGTLSDKFGARRVMYWVLGLTLAAAVLLIVPKMDIFSPGQGVMAQAPGTVTEITDSSITVGDKVYTYERKPEAVQSKNQEGAALFPSSQVWQEPAVELGQEVKKKELLARGVTHIGFQANVWIFTALVFVIGITLGIGKAAVYRHIPDYFPSDVGVVGGMVGVLGGLGGFFGPMIFGSLLEWSGLWTTTWMFIAILTAVCLVWMHRVVQQLMRAKAPEMLRDLEAPMPSVRRGAN